jgi:hypothetical protein
VAARTKPARSCPVRMNPVLVIPGRTTAARSRPGRRILARTRAVRTPEARTEAPFLSVLPVAMLLRTVQAAGGQDRAGTSACPSESGRRLTAPRAVPGPLLPDAPSSVPPVVPRPASPVRPAPVRRLSARAAPALRLVPQPAPAPAGRRRRRPGASRRPGRRAAPRTLCRIVPVRSALGRTWCRTACPAPFLAEHCCARSYDPKTRQRFVWLPLSSKNRRYDLVKTRRHSRS